MVIICRTEVKFESCVENGTRAMEKGDFRTYCGWKNETIFTPTVNINS